MRFALGQPGEGGLEALGAGLLAFGLGDPFDVFAALARRQIA